MTPAAAPTTDRAPEPDDRRAPYLRIEGLSKTFGTFTALRDISLDIYEGEFVCFLGPSGCGKTTLLRAIAGLDIQTSGRVVQAGRDISTLPPTRRDFGIVFQSYALFPNLTVARNVAYGLESARARRPEVLRRVHDLLELVGLADQGEKYPAQLSGGQQQRVALARALATSPGLLLLDEPLSALDAKVRVYLRHEVRALQRRLRVPTVMVTHDQEEALTMADRIVVMNQGVIEQIGTPLQVYREPASAFVADFIGTMNFALATVVGATAVRLGEVVLACGADGLAPGARVTVAIRPEDILLQEGPGAGEPVENVLRARVASMVFLGSFFRAELGDQTLGATRLRADLPVDVVRRLGLTDGRTVLVALPRERLLVFPAGDGAS
jgi:iron(III) transport system ATP-binding protein